MLQHRFMLAAVASAISIGAAGCGPGASATERKPAAGPPPVVVHLAPVVRGAVQRTIQVTGTLYGDEEAMISAELGGRVEAIYKDLGDIVLPGEPLAQIDRRVYELELMQSQASLLAALARVGLGELPSEDFDPEGVPTVASAKAESANAAARLDRGRQLYEESPPMISAQEFADLQTAAEVAAGEVEVSRLNARAALADARTRASEVAAAEERASDTTVRAPGPVGAESPQYRVASRSVALGEYVTPGRSMFRLVATDPVKFRATVPERYAAEVRTGQSADAFVEAYSEAFSGVVARIAPQIDPISRAFTIEVRLPNADGRLKPGAFATGSIFTRWEDGVVFVPEAAVVTFAGVQKVFTVSNGRAVEHIIRTGSRRDGMVEIVDGLVGDSVVTQGADTIANNAPVAPHE